MNSELEMLELLLGDLLAHPPPGVSSTDIEGWIRSHASELCATIRRTCAAQSGHYYQVDDTWYVDNQFLQNLATRHETLPMRADWQVLLPQGVLWCRSKRGLAPLPGQVGVLYACEPDEGLDVAAALHQWAQEDGLARLEGQWQQWPAASAAITSAPSKTVCGGCGAACACTGCRAEHDHTEDHA